MWLLIIKMTVKQKSLSLDKMGFKISNNRCTMKVRSYKLILHKWGKVSTLVLANATTWLWRGPSRQREKVVLKRCTHFLRSWEFGTEIQGDRG